MKKHIEILTYRIICLLMFMVFAGSVHAQIMVKGKIIDTDGAPLIGATILEQGTTNGVAAAIDGSYTLQVKGENSILIFSYIGYAQQNVKVGNRRVIDMILKEDAINMNEVVVTGYGRTVTKDKLTASISKVSKEILESGVRANPLSALAGSVTGVRVSTISGQPGKAPTVVIRGGAALNGTGKPLYVIDGIQKDDMNDVNSNDIESIEVLKDAAATALYGARANAGVVLISTKKGQIGKAEVSFKANYGLNYMRNTNDFLDADDYLYYMRLAAYRSGNFAALTAAGPYGTGNDYNADGNKSAAGVYSTMLLSDENRFLLDQGWKAMVDPITGKSLIYNEFSPREGSIREVATTQDYNVSISGGNEKGKYYSSIGYYKETGFPIMSGYDRLSFALNGSYRINPWIESSSSLNFSKSELDQVSDYRSQGEAEFFGLMFSAPPTMRQYNLNGELISSTTNYQNGNWSASIDKFYRRNTNYRFTMSEALKLNFTDHLNLKVSGMWYFNMWEKEAFNKAFTSKPGTMDKNRKSSASYSRMLSQTYNAILGYENSWNNHNLSMIAGIEYFDKYNFGLSASGQGADSDDFIALQYTVIDPNNSSMRTSHANERIMSAFMNGSYDYKGKYLLSFSVRCDGYSKLINNRWGFFPGVSAAWNVHRENFMQNVWGGKLTSLKVRAGYGQNGNVNIVAGPYDLQGNYGNTANYNGTYGTLINKLPYPDLLWEKTTSTDVAIEAGFMDKVRVQMGFYNKLTSDLLATVPFPSSAGVTNQYTNNGSVRNRGLEFEVDATVYDCNGLKIRIGGNATYMRSKIISLPNNGNGNNRQNGMQVYNPKSGELIWVGGYQEGQEYGESWAYQMIGIVRDETDLTNYGWYVDKVPSKPIYGPEVWKTLTAAEQAGAMLLQPGDAVFQDVNGDNIIDAYDQVSQGNTVPRWMGGLNFSIDWRGLSLFARFDYAAGYSTFNKRKQYYMAASQGTFNTLKESKDTWSEQHQDAKYPILMYADLNNRKNYRTSNIFYDNSSYLCARDISLSYTMPEAWSKTMLMKSLTFTVTGQNLFYITKSSLYNPEYGVSGDGGYPTPRTVLFGVRATF